MRKGHKLSLINDYISIHHILLGCKSLLLDSANSRADIRIIELLCDTALDLKSKYEKTFKKLKMYDLSFDILNKDLNMCKNAHITTDISTIKGEVDTINYHYSLIPEKYKI